MLRKVGTQVVKWTTEGAVKEDTQNFKTSSILRREGIRQLPGICWYPVRAQAIVKQGGTAGSVNDPPMTESASVKDGSFTLHAVPPCFTIACDLTGYQHIPGN